MADAPAYTTVPGKIPALLTKIRETGVPPKAVSQWLPSLGFTSSNDRTLLNVLRQIGFTDASGVPQPAWKQYRGADHKAVLGRALKWGYQSLFETYPDANKRTATELSHFFSTQTDVGKQAIDKMVATFRTLAEQAEFSDSDVVAPEATTPLVTPAAPGPGTLVSRSSAGGLNLNINVELTLPETTDERVFEAFFKAMRKHLLADEDS
jgi:Family of unknown function (DUF5343)